MNADGASRPRILGQALPRRRAARLVAGQGRFVDDIALPRMLHAAFVRSPVPFGTITAIDTTAARAHPGVALVATGRDLVDRIAPFRGEHKLFAGMKAPLQRAVAVDRVAFQGEPVAIVVAESRAAAEDAAALVTLDIDPAEGHGDAVAAAAPGASPIHPDLGDNVAHDMAVQSGDPDAAFAAAAHVVEETFRFARVAGVALETRGILADFAPRDEALTVHQSHQCPGQMQDIYARLLGLPEHRVRVICPDVGGAFGVKQQLYGDEIAVCAASMMLGRPVKFVADRIESFASDIHAREHVVRGRMAIDGDGRILAVDVDDIFGIGAYSQYPRSSIGEGSHVLRLTAAAYRMDAYRARVRMVLQNKVNVGHYRAVGHPIAVAVGEALVDRAARTVGLDPLEMRRRNTIPDDAYPYPSPGGFRLDALCLEACLARLEETIDVAAFRREQARLAEHGVYRGLGLATFVELTGTGAEYYGRGEVRVSARDGCHVRLEPSGVVRCFTSATEQGQGTDMAIAMVVADTLGVGVDEVDVESGDSATAPSGGGAWASRAASTGVEAAHRAAGRLRDEILRLAAAILQTSPERLHVADGEVRDADGAARMTLAEIGRIGHYRQDLLPSGVQPELSAIAHYAPTERPFLITGGLQAAVVEVDVGLGNVRLLRHLVIHDSGTVINPLLLDEQIRGGVVQGLGAALFEEVRYAPDGTLLTGSFADYRLPMAAEMPDIEVYHVGRPDPATTVGAKGAGEAGTAGAVGAVLNAVNDALHPLGARLTEVPLSPDRILAALGRT